MPTDSQQKLAKLIRENENWLMERILNYASQHGYTRYTSTLKEAWRASIAGISTSILDQLQSSSDIPEFGPDEDWFADPCGEFGRIEADKHRHRGISLAMFLSFMKYYRQSYFDLIRREDSLLKDDGWCELFLHRIFDRIEISFSAVWEQHSDETKIEDLRHTNRILTNEKNKYLTMFESYSLPCLFVDIAGNLDSMNLSAAKLFRVEATPGAHYYQSSPETFETPPQFLDKEITCFASGTEEEYHFEKQLVVHDQSWDFLVMFKRMLDVSCKFSGVLVSLMDIRAQKELEQAHSKLKATQSQLLQHEKMASIGQLAAGVAHEINNPIGFVKSNLSTLRKYTDMLVETLNRCTASVSSNINVQADEELLATLKNRKLIQIIADLPDLLDESLDGVDRVSKIVQNLKTFSRVDQQECSSCDLNESLDSALNLVWNELKYKVEVYKDYGELPKLKCHPQQLSQVFLNLLINSVHAIESKGEIHLRTGLERDRIWISIRDTGYGMSDETKCRLFEPFYTTKDVGKGTGLGMSIVYDIIEQHGGTIEVESTLGKGSCFTLSFPLQPIQGEEKASK